ncbi:MAG: SUMF1/EgtB/PvdO family nonheme iron enzyme, partial [Gemmataceae bacterium]|nr:SUMF1/EgtB/PvdO family nonheme iron enzyme [Gemmataceae bacterium]
MVAHQEGAYEFTDTVTGREVAVLRRAMASQPHDRYLTCTAFAADLADALGLPFAGHRRGNLTPPQRPALPDPAPAARTTTGSTPGRGTVAAETLSKNRRRPPPGLMEVSESMPALYASPAEELPPEVEVELEPEEDEPARPRGGSKGRGGAGKWVLVFAGAVALGTLVALGGWLVTGGGRRPPTEFAKATNPTPPPTDKTDPINPGPDPKPPVIKGDEKGDNKPPDPKLVEPPKPKWVYPERFQPAAGASEVRLLGKVVPDRIVARWNDQDVEFRLVAPESGSAMKLFYISRTKITNKQFSGEGDDVPVMGVTAAEARAFARKAFGGDLPTADEWDAAAGWDRLARPDALALPGSQPHVGATTAAPVTRAKADENRIGLIDMVGNGREWTRTVFTRDGERKLFAAAPLADTDKLILRGRAFFLDRPLTFALLEVEQTQPQTASPAVGSPCTGFRVVVPVP